MNIPKLAFVCVNFNNASYTKRFCDSLERQSGRDSQFLIECIIVDNSTDTEDSKILIGVAEERPWIRCLQAPNNMGYFGGLNYGLQHAPLDDYCYVIICNNDLTFEVSFCQELCSKNYDSQIYAICPDVITKDGVHQNPHLLKRMGWWRRLQLDVYFAHYYFAYILLETLRVVRPQKSSPQQPVSGCELHMGIGACYILTRSFLNQFTQLHYPHFLYGEEAYFSNQIHSVGGVLWFDPVLRLHHAESATLSKVPKRMSYEFAREGYSSYKKML